MQRLIAHIISETPHPSIVDAAPHANHLESKFPGYSRAYQASLDRFPKPFTLRHSAIYEATKLVELSSRNTATHPIALSLWQRAQIVLSDLHHALWSKIQCSAHALALLPLHGGTPSLLLAFADYARAYSGDTKMTWFDRLLADVEDHDCVQYKSLCASLSLPFRSPKQVLEMWLGKIGNHILMSGCSEEFEVKRRLEFEFYMREVARTQRSANSSISHEPLTIAFYEYELLRMDPAFRLDPCSCPDYPRNIDESTSLFHSIYLSLFTITMGVHEYMDNHDLRDSSPKSPFTERIIKAFDVIKPKKSFSLLHMYPKEVRAFRKLRQSCSILHHQSLYEQLGEHDLTGPGRAIFRERMLTKFNCGVNRYILPCSDVVGLLTDTLLIDIDDDPLSVVEDVANFQLHQLYFGGSRFCGPAGTAWQFIQIYRLSGGKEMSFDEAILLIEAVFKYMGMLHHTLSEIIWVVGREFGLDLVDLYEHFF
ncbi:hypothetical protein HDU83_002228 [Entophlyctis luteolus]|nr:hypothetical protein HDU82_000605 [Entophlyctis luteolus]KAJ3355943.1 hypothetical protein HDU83_002228 [Entophlyctis luteolus]KAJ3388573.1 hypothetical protein HDU84_009671 [Entophlyctis sp. JEL0112]